MDILQEQLASSVREQIALEEHFHTVLNQQIALVDETRFLEAKNLLERAKEVLELHFAPLNGVLDELEASLERSKFQSLAQNGKTTVAGAIGSASASVEPVSRILRDDYSALNLITMSNTLLHTMALALDSRRLAAIALSHLENLAPLVVQLGELIPPVVAQELHALSATIDLGIAGTALKNSKRAWKKPVQTG